MLTEDDMWLVCRRLRPELSYEEFKEMWDEFLELKRRKDAN